MKKMKGGDVTGEEMEERREADVGARRRKMPLRGEEATFFTSSHSKLHLWVFQGGERGGGWVNAHFIPPLCCSLDVFSFPFFFFRSV